MTSEEIRFARIFLYEHFKLKLVVNPNRKGYMHMIGHDTASTNAANLYNQLADMAHSTAKAA